MDCGFRLLFSFFSFLDVISDGLDRDASRSRAAFNLSMYASIAETTS
jgi:hypothetical protein